MDRALLGYQRKNRATPVSVAYLLRAVGACDLAAVRAAVVDRARRFPVLTQRLTYPAGPAGWPAWVPDPRYDVSAHVREYRLPEGAGEPGLRAFVERRCQAVMPLDAPPWEVWLLRGPDPGGFCVLVRASHVWLDGTALNLVLSMLFGAGDTDAVAPSRWLREGRATPAATALAFGRLLGWTTPSASLDALTRPLSGDFHLHWATTRVERLRAVGRAYDASINDVFLVALSGALDAWSRPVGGRRRLRALMPVSARRPDERGRLSNFVVGARVCLPRGPTSPWRRFEVVQRQTSRYRGGTDVGAGERWWFERIPARYGRTAVAMGMDPRRVAVTTSNLGVMPGPMTVAGRPVIEAVPVPVPPPGQRLFVILSGLGPTATLGIAADRNVPNSASLADLWLTELGRLEQAAGFAAVAAQTSEPATSPATSTLTLARLGSYPGALG
jgi:diacylglycerol O-acyltransferase